MGVVQRVQCLVLNAPQTTPPCPPLEKRGGRSNLNSLRGALAMKTEPTIGNYLDDEERDLVEAIEADDVVSKNYLTPARKGKLQAMARATLNAEREKIALWISRDDLARIKSKAMQEGMPYQTLINWILHKAVR